jgi:hypothetical protein
LKRRGYRGDLGAGKPAKWFVHYKSFISGPQYDMRTEITNAEYDSQAVACVEGFGGQAGDNSREATVAVA